MKTTPFLLILAFTLSLSHVQAQEEADISAITLTGSVDAYFRTNFNAPNKGEHAQAPGTSFANLPGFALGMANMVAAYKGEKVGFVADLVYGPRGAGAVFLETGSARIVKSCHLYRKPE